MNLKGIFNLLKDTFSAWSAAGAARLGAALAYYTVFSIAPLLIIIISLAGLIFGQQAVRGQIAQDVTGIVGASAATMIQTMVKGSSESRSGVIGAVIGLVTLFLGAVGLVNQLKDGLNILWQAPQPKTGIVATILGYAFSFIVVLGVVVLLIASIVLTAIVGWLGNFLNSLLPGLSIIISVANLLVSFGLVVLLFALIYKLLPNVEIDWSDVWIGALVTALLFTIGKVAIGFYLGHSNVGSGYGAAGSLVVILVWAYYSAQIIFFGAEFCHVYASEYGSQHVKAIQRRRQEAEERARAVRPDLATRARTGLAQVMTPRFYAAAAVSLVVGALSVLESWARRQTGAREL